ncbi:MAG: type II toxin-antitoxin system VapC family toxin [Spirochaetota bacterium]
MKIVADTNIFLAVVLNAPEKEWIIRITEGHNLAAPDVLPFEIGNALTAMMRKRILNADNLTKVWDIVQKIPVELRSIDIRASIEKASRLNIYAYDAYFIECALNLRSPLITLDQRLKKIAGNEGISILE